MPRYISPYFINTLPLFSPVQSSPVLSCPVHHRQRSCAGRAGCCAACCCSCCCCCCYSHVTTTTTKKQRWLLSPEQAQQEVGLRGAATMEHGQQTKLAQPKQRPSRGLMERRARPTRVFPEAYPEWETERERETTATKLAKLNGGKAS